MNAFMRWLREKWAAMFPGKVYILNFLGIPTSGQGIGTLPYTLRLNSRAPNSVDLWACHWDISPAHPGITLDHPDSAYVDIHFAAGVPFGRYTITCSYVRARDAAVFTAQFLITVVDTSQYE